MSSSASGGDGPQRVNITQLSLQQLSQLKQQVDSEIDLFTRSLQQLKVAENKFQESANNVDAMKTDGGNAVGKEMLIPLSSSMYVPGRVSNTEKVIVEIGTGYYVNMSFDKAADYFRRKVAFVQKQMEKVQEAGQEKLKVRSMIEDVLQVKVQAQIQSQGKAIPTAS